MKKEKKIKKEKHVKKLITEKLLHDLLEQSKYDEIKKVLIKAEPADVADVFEDLTTDKARQLFEILEPDHASDIIIEMDPHEMEDVVDELSPEKLADMIHEMADDDAVDFFSDMEPEEQNAVLLHLKDEQRIRLKELLDYEEDSAGGLMTLELCSVKSTSTVQQVINFIAASDFADPISTIFIVDEKKMMMGSIGISELLAEGRNTLMSEVKKFDDDPVFAYHDEDQESIANKFMRYDLYTMPVVDENCCLIGRITADDVMDVMVEEANEDIAHMAGAPDLEHHEESPLSIVRLRLPWLMITMTAGMLISMVVQQIMGLSSAEGLAAFIPVIMGMGGNTGMQASAVTIRSIALGEIQFDRLFGVFFRELLVGVTMGSICGVIIAVMVWLDLRYLGGGTTQPIYKLAGVVSVSMCCAMTFASFAGTILPIILHRVNIDPAVASGPFVTTGNDLSASLIYFLMCYCLLG